MLKDYYRILGVAETATAEEITSAYRVQAMRWHPDKNPDSDTTEQMKDINEAYSILSNPQSRMRYDKEYQFFRYAYPGTQHEESSSVANNSYDIQDENLKADVENARRAAEDYVREFYASLKKDTVTAAKGAWNGMKPYIVAAAIMTFIGLIVVLSDLGSNSVSKEPEVQIPKMIEEETTSTEGWTNYRGGDAFQLSVPATVELRNANDAYSQTLHRLSLTENDGNIIFQQEGLAEQKDEAYEKYCRIMIQYIKGSDGDFMKSNEKEDLNYEWKELFDELVAGAIGSTSKLMGRYTYKWEVVNGANCIQIDYKRMGTNFDTSIPVICRIAIFQNNNEMVKLILSYREKEADLWQADFEKVFKSFKWI